LREALFWGARMTAFLVGIGIALHLATVLEWWIWLAAIGGVMAVFLIVSLMSRNKTASSEHEWSP
jgi:type II secretory pathway component PulF